MRILLINPPYRAITIRGMGPQVPLGLLSIGGPLIDAGHEVRLLNAEEPLLADAKIVARVPQQRLGIHAQLGIEASGFHGKWAESYRRPAASPRHSK
ncbi:MAG: hypothetical protein HY055_16190 [Magnetospirillum sp.]|nr:hypothetical protein [Magnetospirillum sp.]